MATLCNYLIQAAIKHLMLAPFSTPLTRNWEFQIAHSTMLFCQKKMLILSTLLKNIRRMEAFLIPYWIDILSMIYRLMKGHYPTSITVKSSSAIICTFMVFTNGNVVFRNFARSVEENPLASLLRETVLKDNDGFEIFSYGRGC